jgi:hypothetical protein
VSNRLKVYLTALVCLSSSAAKDNLRKGIVSLYAHVLAFLARAIRAQKKNSIARIMEALWSYGNLTEFEDKCHRLCARVSEDARICDGQAIIEVLSRTLHEIHELHTSVIRLEDKADLGKLETAKGAMYNSADEGGLSRCLPDTRVHLLEQIFDWPAGHTGKRIFWLCGKAGTCHNNLSSEVDRVSIQVLGAGSSQRWC